MSGYSAKREGLVSDLSPAEQRSLRSSNRRRMQKVRIGQAKTFVSQNWLELLVGTGVVIGSVLWLQHKGQLPKGW